LLTLARAHPTATEDTPQTKEKTRAKAQKRPTRNESQRAASRYHGAKEQTGNQGREKRGKRQDEEGGKEVEERKTTKSRRQEHRQTKSRQQNTFSGLSTTGDREERVDKNRP